MIMAQILVVDDQAIVRYGTVHLVHEHFRTAQIDTARDINEMVSSLRINRYDLILLDIQIQGGNNFNVLDIIRLRQPDVKVLIFSGYAETVYAHRYISAGARGFVSKFSSEKELQVAIQTVLQGEIYLSQTLKANLNGIGFSGETAANPLHTLSNRELEVLNLLVEGLGAVEISVRLNLQLSTVSTYKRRIFDKLNVDNIIDLVEKSRLYN
jgi:DNA-binding NarL/FixJ family response regulator